MENTVVGPVLPFICKGGLGLKIKLSAVARYTLLLTNISFGSATESGESGKVSLPVSDGDMLYAFNEDDLELYHRYKLEDGAMLSVSFDTLNTNSAYINGSLAFFQITDDPSSWMHSKSSLHLKYNNYPPFIFLTILPKKW